MWRRDPTKFLITMRVVELLCVFGGGVMYMTMLDVLHIYMEFAFGWCVGGCENVKAFLVR